MLLWWTVAGAILVAVSSQPLSVLVTPQTQTDASKILDIVLPELTAGVAAALLPVDVKTKDGTVELFLTLDGDWQAHHLSAAAETYEVQHVATWPRLFGQLGAAGGICWLRCAGGRQALRGRLCGSVERSAC
jgi:hypothetical protein